jgi:hypothetical protein
MNEKLKDQDVLLVREKGSNELHTANMGKDGKVKTAKPEGENPDFLKIDRHGNILENFFANFMRQVKEPTRFEFFRVPVDKFGEVMQKLQEAFKHPDKPENKEFIDAHRVDTDELVRKQTQKEEKAERQSPAQAKQSPPSEYAVNPERVDWSQFERIGISRETLEKTGNLEKLLNWQKTDLLPISPKFDDVTLRTDARLALRENADGKLSLSIHAIRLRPEVDRPYFGVRFSEEDKQNIWKTGNLGRIAEAEFRPGEKTPVYLSIDKQTNELVAIRTDKVKIPENIKGVTLNDEQKKSLSEGKAVWVEGMTSRKNTPFDAFVQFDADRRGFGFRFDNDRKQSQSQQQGNAQNDVPKTFRKQELSEDQRSSLREGKTVHVGGLVDKKGKMYSGYITLNKETGKTDFMFPKDYKDALAAGKVTPDDRHKTQVAVNSEGKTNEATRQAQAKGEPLKKGQSQPDEKQAAKQEQEKPKKSKGMKM